MRSAPAGKPRGHGCRSGLDAEFAEYLHVLPGEARLAEGYGLVVVVQITARPGAVVARVDQRHARVDVIPPDRSHVGHGVEQRVGRGGYRGVCLGGSGLVGEILPVSVGEPRQRSDVELVGRRRGRSVQEAFAPVVEDVLAMVGAVEQRRRSPGAVRAGTGSFPRGRNPCRESNCRRRCGASARVPARSPRRRRGGNARTRAG